MEGMLTPGVLDKLLAMPETLVHLVVVYLMFKVIVKLIDLIDEDKK